MAKPRYPWRNDKSQGGRFKFMSSGVAYCDNGIDNLKQYAPVDQGAVMPFNNSGTQTYAQGFDGTTSRVYDSLTGSSAGASTGSLYRRFRLPRDFGSFPAGAISLFTETTSSPSSAVINLLNAGAFDPTLNNLTILPTVLSTWTFWSFTPGGVYLPGQFLTLQLTNGASAANQNMFFADLQILYVTARGNI